jgi:probable HAF family extracellular repeat protein
MKTWVRSLAALALPAVFAPVCRAQYVCTTIDPPGCIQSTATAISSNNVVGEYQDTTGETHGFLYSGGAFTTLDPAGSIFTQATGLFGPNVVGYYQDVNSVHHGFLYNGTSYVTLDPSGSVSTHASGIYGNNVVGYYIDSQEVYHGFLYNTGGTYTTLDPAGSVSTQATGISGNNVTGYYQDANSVQHGFIYNGAAYTTLDFPGATFTEPTGISGSNVVGYYQDSQKITHGFLYNGSSYATLDPASSIFTQAACVCGNNAIGNSYNSQVPSSTGFVFGASAYTLLNVSGSTYVTGISGYSVAGYYFGSDGVDHAFLASAPSPAPQTFSQWEASYATSGGATGTPENDGIPNLLKYVYDINPTQSISVLDQPALPTLGTDTTTTPGTTYLTLTYRQNIAATGVTIGVQTSPDLKTWSTVVPDSDQQSGVDPTTGDPMMEIKVNLNGAAREFIRLNVTGP